MSDTVSPAHPAVTTRDELSFIKALDLDPSDRILRYAYADYLEELGRDREALLHRWLGDTGRYPASNKDGSPFIAKAEHFWMPLQWGWKSVIDGRWDGKHFNLPYEVGSALNRTETAHYPYQTRHDAELALVQDLVWLAVLADVEEVRMWVGKELSSERATPQA